MSSKAPVPASGPGSDSLGVQAPTGSEILRCVRLRRAAKAQHVKFRTSNKPLREQVRDATDPRRAASQPPDRPRFGVGAVHRPPGPRTEPAHSLDPAKHLPVSLCFERPRGESPGAAGQADSRMLGFPSGNATPFLRQRERKTRCRAYWAPKPSQVWSFGYCSRGRSYPAPEEPSSVPTT